MGAWIGKKLGYALAIIGFILIVLNAIDYIGGFACMEEALGIWLGWGSPIGIGMFMSGLGILFWEIAKFQRKK